MSGDRVISMPKAYAPLAKTAGTSTNESEVDPQAQDQKQQNAGQTRQGGREATDANRQARETASPASPS